MMDKSIGNFGIPKLTQGGLKNNNWMSVKGNLLVLVGVNLGDKRVYVGVASVKFRQLTFAVPHTFTPLMIAFKHNEFAWF